MGSALYAGITQRKYSRLTREEEAQKRQDKLASSSIAAQVDLTKDVLDNWKDIVRSLGAQISDLHGQVASLEDRERKCQIELISMKAKVIQIEGRLAPGRDNVTDPTTL